MREDMFMECFGFMDGATSQAAFDELGIGNRIGPNTVFLHKGQGFHGRGEVSSIAGGSKFIK